MARPHTAPVVIKCTLECITYGAVNTQTSHLITTILNAGDHRADLSAFEAPKREDLYDLLARDTCKTVPASVVQPGSNIIGSRLFIAIKDINSKSTRYKGGIVAQGHTDVRLCS